MNDLLAEIESDLIFKQQLNLAEHNIYGSSRLGVKQDTTQMYFSRFTANSIDTITGNIIKDSIIQETIAQVDTVKTQRVLGYKQYELNNHLGNVLAVISDKRIYVSDTVISGDTFALWDAHITSAQDYYPFGMLMPNRHWVESDSSLYLYGFQGQMGDMELLGFGNSYAFKYRIHDTRTGRFYSVDPLAPDYPWNSPYAFSENSLIAFVELEGLEKVSYTDERVSGVTVGTYQTVTPSTVENSSVKTQVQVHTVDAAGSNTPLGTLPESSGASQAVTNVINSSAANTARDANLTFKGNESANPNAMTNTQGQFLRAPQQFDIIGVIGPAGGRPSDPANPPTNSVPVITQLITGVHPGTTVMASNTRKFLIITNGTAASVEQAQSDIKKLSLANPNVQFALATDSRSGLNNDQKRIIQNPTQAGILSATTGVLTYVTTFQDSAGRSTPLIPAPPQVNNQGLTTPTTP